MQRDPPPDDSVDQLDMQELPVDDSVDQLKDYQLKDFLDQRDAWQDTPSASERSSRFDESNVSHQTSTPSSKELDNTIRKRKRQLNANQKTKCGDKCECTQMLQAQLNPTKSLQHIQLLVRGDHINTLAYV